MNKKVLVITLALVVALAGSAMAEVKFGGDFTASIKQENFKAFKESYTLKPSFQFKISASNKNETKSSEVVESVVVDAETGEEIVVLETKENKQTNWDFSARVNSHTTVGNVSALTIDWYKLELNDQYFNAWFWGAGNTLSAKRTAFDFIYATSGMNLAGTVREYNHRARFEVPVMDLATVTVDFKGANADGKGNSMVAFVDGEIEGFNVGLAYERRDWTATTSTDNIVAHGSTEFDAGAYAVDVKAAAGVTLGDDLGFALGLGAETNVTDEVEVEASVKFENEHWKGGGFDVAGQATVLGLGATYEVTNLKATASFEQTLQDPDNSNELNLDVRYRFSDKVAFNRLFNTNTSYVMWYENDAPAVRAYADIVDFKFSEQLGTKVGAEVAAPVVENLVWARAKAEHGYYKYSDATKPLSSDPEKFEDAFDTGYSVLGELYIKPMDKLTIMPLVSYASIGSVLELKAVASYKIGFSDAKLTFTAQKITADDIQKMKAKELLEAKVTIPF